MKAYRF